MPTHIGGGVRQGNNGRAQTPCGSHSALLAPILVTLVALAGAEGVTILLAPRAAGLALHAILLVVLLGAGAMRRDRPARDLLLALALAPLIRVLGLSLPLAGHPSIVLTLAIGAPLLVAAGLAARELGLTPDDLGITLRGLLVQLAVGILGLPLGFVAHAILRPEPVVGTLVWGSALPVALVLMVSTGLAEELVFRGLIQRAATGAVGRFGFVYGAAVYAALHISYGSLPAVGWAWVVGLLFGWIVERTGSLFGVTLAHGFAALVALLAVPSLT